MNQTEREETTRAVEQFLNESLERILLSNPVNPQQLSRARLRPLLIKGELRFQVEGGGHLRLPELSVQAIRHISCRLFGVQIAVKRLFSRLLLGSGLILVSKKGKVTVKVKGRGKTQAAPARITPMSHNRQKRYILEEGIAVPFLVDLGVMTKEGRVVNSRYDKFRQINRFLEMVEDVLPGLDKGRENTIIDFGCGKSYLTFAMYYYLRELRGYQVRIIGLDLKEDVIAHCEKLARAYGYEGLSFTCGDIAGYEGVDQVDMVVTLHACDTATDYALAKAVGWGAKVILSVPCCQHELNGQMENQLMGPVFQYGLIKERMAALYTDAIRAQVLEHMGYRTQILEFIDMEHTPKNILIRAVKQGKRKDNEAEIRELVKFLNVSPTIVRELMGENDAE